MAVESDVKIGNARGVYYNRADDVVVQNWYNRASRGGWDYCARLKSGSASTIAEYMIKACNNNNVVYMERASGGGYIESQRYEVYDWIKNNGGSIRDIGTLSETKHCDCSSLASAMLLYAGIDVGQPNTSSMYNAISKTGKFDIFDNNRQRFGALDLRVGDIIWSPTRQEGQYGHAAIVVETPSELTPIEERNTGFGRPSESNVYTMNRPDPVVEQAPMDLTQYNDMQLFLLGAIITGGEAAVTLFGKSAKSFLPD